MTVTDTSQQFLDEHQQLQPGESFRFACHPGVRCFNACCSNLSLMLTPYDTLRLRRHTGQSSREFVRLFADLLAMPGVGLPLLKMKMLESAGRKCPFQRPEGCAVYPHRPSACRTYPLGRATQPKEGGEDGAIEERLFVIRPTRHLALCRSMLPQHPAYPSLGHSDRQISSQLIDAAPPPRGA